MHESEIKNAIREFLLQKLKVASLRDEDNYFQLGFVNSLFAMQLVLFVEKQFHLQVGDDDLAIENFNSINAIAALVGRKLPVAEGSSRQV